MSATCPIGPLEALAAAKAAGIRMSLDGGRILLEAANLPSDRSQPRRPMTAQRNAGQTPCSGFIASSLKVGATVVEFLRAAKPDLLHVLEWRAALMGWTKDELYRVPPCWGRFDLTGAALLIGQSRVIAVTEASIVIETHSGARLKFRRIGREHLA
jgi:hypothetical protein